jgi:NADH-quinone oxidoreductase subunit A
MLSEFLKDYLPIILFLIIALGLSCAFVVVNFILSPKKPDPEKLSAYECGFEPFDDSRMEFDVRFYLVAILFIIFDLEIAFFFLGQFSWRNRHLGFLVNDVFFSVLNYWFYL